MQTDGRYMIEPPVWEVGGISYRTLFEILFFKIKEFNIQEESPPPPCSGLAHLRISLN